MAVIRLVSAVMALLEHTPAQTGRVGFVNEMILQEVV